MAFSPPDPPVVFTDYPNHTTPTNAQNLNATVAHIAAVGQAAYDQLVGAIESGQVVVGGSSGTIDGGTP